MATPYANPITRLEHERERGSGAVPFCRDALSAVSSRRNLMRTAVAAVGAVTIGSTALAPSAAAQVAGATFFPVDPYRAYDSRLPRFDLASPDGPLIGNAGGDLAAQASRTVTLWQPHSSPTERMPIEARAAAYNITVTQATAAGSLRITPAGSGPPQTAAVNWGPGYNTIGNAGITKTNNTQQVDVWIRNGVQAHFIIDITGYFSAA